MKKLTALLLAALLVLGLTACGSSAYETLEGKWLNYDPLSDDSCDSILEDLGFYDSEIECFEDVDPFEFVDYVEFNADKTYELGTDKKATKKAIKAWIEELFEALYENRADIFDYDGYFNDCADVEAFCEEYVYIFYSETYSDFDELLAEMVDLVWDGFDLEVETGTYTASSTRIGFKMDGDKDFSYAEYSTSGSKLKITYADGSVTYVKD